MTPLTAAVLDAIASAERSGRLATLSHLQRRLSPKDRVARAVQWLWRNGYLARRWAGDEFEYAVKRREAIEVTRLPTRAVYGYSFRSDEPLI